MHKVGTVSTVTFCIHSCSNKTQQSCGYAVPLYAFQSHRTKLLNYFNKKENADRKTKAEHRSDGGLKAYWALKNLKSIDGLPGLSLAHTADITPQSIFDEAEERKPYKASVLMQSQQNSGNIKFLAGFLLGIALSMIYVTLVGVA